MQLPKFTIGGGGKDPGANVPRGELHISPTVYFEGRWIEGAFNSVSDPYAGRAEIVSIGPEFALSFKRTASAF